MEKAIDGHDGTMTTIRTGDARYPAALRHVHGPPPALYLRGAVEALGHPLPVAVVGTRSMTAYGAAVARRLGRDLARAGAAVVSGLALGIDAQAHAGALDAGGVTVAVLAAGVDAPSVGPRTNAPLAEMIVRGGGALVSEHPPGTPASRHAFPRRNRIIAGLCRAVVVVEAAERSGALITARLALEAGREVFAVPGPITSPASAGTNALIKQGAAPLTGAADLLDALGIAPPPARDRDASPYLPLIAAGRGTIDELARSTGQDPRAVAAAIVALEIEGRVTEKDGRLAVI